ncbi:hypothetical protein [Tolypothrix sp. VBCCA 56010]|uniref:hypothetical protein n=1 Tax=Tolypothrix sp. VBCCA 56010 TaxID=3137731 RepID=UPI003D7D1ED7
MGIGQWELKKRLYAGARSNTILSMPNAHCPMPIALLPITHSQQSEKICLF